MKWITFLSFFSINIEKMMLFIKAYDSLLKQFARIGIRRDESQTFREYALHVDTLYNSTDMQQLTFNYESAIYQKGQAAAEWKKSVHLWEVLMKKATSPPKSNDFHSAI